MAAVITFLLTGSAATLTYMGYAYLDGFLSHFSLQPANLGYRPDEYLLFGLNLFAPSFLPWLAGAPLILAAVVHRARLVSLLPAHLRTAGRWLRAKPPVKIATNSAIVGAVVTATGSALAVVTLSGWRVDTTLILAFVIFGPLLLSWPARAVPLGRIAFAVAIVISVFCLIWAASLYARERGREFGYALIADLPHRNQVAIYSEEMLALNAPGVVRDTFTGAKYAYRYQGLRFLLSRGDYFYLIPAITPAQWLEGHGRTFVIKDEDDVRLEILPGVRTPG